MIMGEVTVTARRFKEIARFMAQVNLALFDWSQIEATTAVDEAGSARWQDELQSAA